MAAGAGVVGHGHGHDVKVPGSGSSGAYGGGDDILSLDKSKKKVSVDKGDKGAAKEKSDKGFLTFDSNMMISLVTAALGTLLIVLGESNLLTPALNVGTGLGSFVLGTSFAVFIITLFRQKRAFEIAHSIPEDERPQELYRALTRKDYILANALLEMGIDCPEVSITNEENDETNLLAQLISNGNADAIKFLLNKKVKFGFDQLECSIDNNQPEILRLLIARGVRVENSGDATKLIQRAENAKKFAHANTKLPASDEGKTSSASEEGKGSKESTSQEQGKKEKLKETHDKAVLVEHILTEAHKQGKLVLKADNKSKNRAQDKESSSAR